MPLYTITARTMEVVTIEVEAEDADEAIYTVKSGGGTRVEPLLAESMDILSVEEEE